MQRVISRVHQIVTSGADATGAPSASASLEGLATAASAASPVAPPLLVPASSSGNSASNASAAVASSSFSPSALQRTMTMATTTVISNATTSAVAAAAAPSAAQQKEITLAVERLQYATLLGERKKAVASLLELARAYYATEEEAPSGRGDEKRRGTATPHYTALGLAAIPVVLTALLSDPRDTELMEAMLELLQEFVSTSPATATAMLTPSPPPAARSAHSSLRSAANVSMSGTQLCLQLLQDPSPWIRGPTIALVKSMQEAQQKEFAASVLECKEGLRRLLEVVEDKREHIRDAALQVLVKMTEREKNVQQFLAFEDGFVRLFQIMEVEGLREGSTVVSDCLQIVNNMLRDNLMNQTLFRDLPYLSTHLPMLLSLPTTSSSEDEEAHDDHIAPSALKATQKKRTMKLVLQLVRFLVSGLHEGIPDRKLDELALRERARKDQDIAQIQSTITRQSDLMGAIGEIVCCGNEELADLQLQALDMIQLLCTGNGGNQIILVNLRTLPSRRSLLSELIKLDISEDESPVGAAATNLLDVLFAKNESAKMAIFQHMNAPPPMDDDAEHGALDLPIPAGRVLLEALITNAEAVVSNKTNQTKKSVRSSTVLAWKACHRFASLVADSAYCKELALRIPSQFEKPDAQTVSGDLFLTRSLKVLHQAPTAEQMRPTQIFQTKIAILTMLIQWCVGCTNAVREMVGSVTTLSVLVDTMTTPVLVSEEPNATIFSKDEIVQIQGLAAILLGTCLEFLIPTPAGVSTGVPTPKRESAASSASQLTRHNLVDLISKKIGLESFANLLIRFQQSPQVVACARTASKHQRARGLLPHRALFSAGGDDDDDGSDGYLFPLYDRSFTVLCRDLAEKTQHRVLSVFTSSGDDEVYAMGGNANVPSAASAYQDLIRMQDKQIQDMQRQISDLTTQVELSSSHSLASGQATQLNTDGEHGGPGSAEFNAEIQRLTSMHNQEKRELELKLTSVVEHSTALESRVQGLSRALEHLEAEHATCGQRRQTDGADMLFTSSAPTDAMTKVMADLEREHAERRHLEDVLRHETQRRHEYEKKIAQDSHAWHMAQLQFQQELDSLRSSLSEKEEQLNEHSEMMDVFRHGQESAKRSAAQAKLDLDRAHQELESLRAINGNTTGSPSSKHEAAAKEMYQLWERERGKVRDLTAELERLQAALSTESSRCQHAASEHVPGTQGETTTIENVHGAECAQLDGGSLSSGEKQDTCHELERLIQENLELGAKLKAMELNKDEKIFHLHAAMDIQIKEIKQLRNVFQEIRTAAEEAAQQSALQNKAIEDLNEELTQAEERAHEERKKTKTTMAELEGEIARMFFEKTETQRKAKASLKQAEQEIARGFLEKVELEKQIATLQIAISDGADEGPRCLPAQHQVDPYVRNGSGTPEAINAIPSRANGDVSVLQPRDIEIDEATAMDDMFIVLASLEIQCNTFRECLEAAQGEQAVVEAVQMSRKRGALVV